MGETHGGAGGFRDGFHHAVPLRDVVCFPDGRIQLRSVVSHGGDCRNDLSSSHDCVAGLEPTFREAAGRGYELSDFVSRMNVVKERLPHRVFCRVRTVFAFKLDDVRRGRIQPLGKHTIIAVRHSGTIDEDPERELRQEARYNRGR